MFFHLPVWPHISCPMCACCQYRLTWCCFSKCLVSQCPQSTVPLLRVVMLCVVVGQVIARRNVDLDLFILGCPHKKQLEALVGLKPRNSFIAPSNEYACQLWSLRGTLRIYAHIKVKHVTAIKRNQHQFFPFSETENNVVQHLWLSCKAYF